ncbi:MAG: hypothetical protein KBF92_06900 [Bacteroidia bacterium]|nr:hypothetical protein [Bacteroidia bacterium]
MKKKSIMLVEKTQIHNKQSTFGEEKNPSHKVTFGYGKCKSCGCRGWKPNYPKNDYCKDCGHHWLQHE